MTGRSHVIGGKPDVKWVKENYIAANRLVQASAKRSKCILVYDFKFCIKIIICFLALSSSFLFTACRNRIFSS